MKEFKVVVLGPGGVGKSALTVQFISGKFVERYDPTVEDFYRKEIEVDGDPAILEILDTAGTEQFASMRDLYIKNGQGFIIVYSLTSRQSFQDIKLIREQILRVKGTDHVPIVLAANKCDLADQQREVSTQDGFDLAGEWCIPYIETSAKNSSIVNCLFTEIVKEMNMKSNSYFNGRFKEKKKCKSKPSKKSNLKSANLLSSTNTTTTTTTNSGTSNTKASLSHTSTLSFTSNGASKFKQGSGEGCLDDADDCCCCCYCLSCACFRRCDDSANASIDYGYDNHQQHLSSKKHGSCTII